MFDFQQISRYRENNRLEAKLATGGLPRSIWETYSAFANTYGGVILLGVEELPDHTLRVQGLLEPRELVDEFTALLQNPRVVSANLLTPGDIQVLHVDGGDIVAITVPPAEQDQRPVYIGGDLARGSKRLRKALDAAGKSYIKLVASNGLDEKKIANMELYEHAHFDSYGVGENLITSASDPVFGGVYKLVAVKRPDGSYQPKMKCSDSVSKAIIPGKKMPWRLYDENGQAQCDLIAMDGEVIEAGKPVTMVNLDSDAIERIVTIVPTRVRQLLVPHILNGELAIELPSIAEKKAYIAKQLTEETWESELRIEMPHKHYVNMTPAVAECRSKMYAELHGGKV